jgi:hypothetical protein
MEKICISAAMNAGTSLLHPKEKNKPIVHQAE